MVQPADPENCIHLGDTSDEDSDLSLQPDALNPDATSINEDAELPPIASDDCKDHQDEESSEEETDAENSGDSNKKKKKKNRFKRVWSWMKMTFLCCVFVDMME
ncbi:RNA polymerase-associated protein LEO1-like [Stegastes partitus]|uniref:RNA polymerase-associated protein LEO1-like n=1 Tax=Stegastes partitus TaxID=144197 RepID=A0A9Y4MVK4_9TELE|nr:PREDICTED: RNA polymerase-associated protein LEO1-like [Stegastes partitus]